MLKKSGAVKIIIGVICGFFIGYSIKLFNNEPVKKTEILMLNVNAAATVGIVQNLGKNEFSCTLKRPVCASAGSRVTISRRVGARWRLIGYGVIVE